MSGSVGDVCDEVERFSFRISEKTVNSLDDDLDEVNVFPFVEASDIICVGYFAFVENQVDGAGVVFYKQPVAHILALAIHRQRFAVADIVDKKRYQLFGELVWPIIVGAVGHEGRHAVCVVICTHKVVA